MPRYRTIKMPDARLHGSVPAWRVRKAVREVAHSSWLDDDAPLLPSLSVDMPQDAHRTGLLDKDGNELVRYPDPIGFTAKCSS